MDPNTPDLPATQPQAPLTPYAQGVPMGMPLDDDMGGGSFSIIGLLHSVRRQLLPALLAGLCISTLLAGVLWFVIPVTYLAESYLRVNREQFQGTVGDFMIYKETQGQLVKSTFVVNRALNDSEISQLPMVKTDNFGRLRKRRDSWLSNAIKVKIDEDELLYVTLRGRSKEQTEKILGAVIQAYESEIVNKERLEKVSELTKLRKRHQRIYDDLVKETEAIKKLAERVGGLESDVIRHQQSLKLGDLRAAQAEYEQLKRGLLEAQTKFNLLQVETQMGSGAISENLVLDEMDQNPQFYNVGLAIQEYKDQIERMSEFVQPGSSQIEQLQSEIAFLERKRQRMLAELRPRVVERLKQRNGMSSGDLQRELTLQNTLMQNLARQLGAAKASYEQKREDVESFGGTSGELIARSNIREALQRDLQVVNEAMNTLEMEIDGRERISIIQQPYVSKPSTLIGKLIQIAGGWVMSFVGVIAAIAYWDYIGKKVNGSQDLVKSTRVIGSLPSIQGNKSNIEGPMRIAADGLRTAILYNKATPAQCVLVTSATGQEGRSTVASQLAISMARAGKTTLLIDGDLRNPQQHTAFAVQPTGGLGEMLRGEQTSDQAIVPTSVESVWLLSAGHCDQNALRGLAGEQARAIFEDFRARFDMIIVDASPVLTSPDALLLGQNTDAAVVSVRRDVSQLPKVQAATEQLSSVGIPIIGTVLNGGVIEKRTGNVATVAPDKKEEQPALTA